MLVEARRLAAAQPGGRFSSALSTRQPALRQASVQALTDEIARLDAAWRTLARRYLAVDDVAVPGAQRLPLRPLAELGTNRRGASAWRGVKCGGFLPCAWHRP